MEAIDIVMVSYLRFEFTRQCLEYLKDRTRTPYRLILVDNGSGSEIQGKLNELYRQGFINHLVLLEENYGIHAGKNIGLSMVHSYPYYIDTDNDIFVPDLEPDWLAQVVDLMNKNLQYGAIGLQPQIMVGHGGVPEDSPEVFETNHIGAYMRIHRTELVKKVGGWKNVFDSKRNDEEKTIAAKIHNEGLKIGITKDIRCWHSFGKNWGYPEELIPEGHGHREIWPPSEHYDKIKVNEETWKPV